MQKLIKVSSLCVAVTCVSGCASLELLAVGGISYLLTGKGLSDHALSAVMDKDCALHRYLTDEAICGEPVEATLVAEQAADSHSDGVLSDPSAVSVAAANHETIAVVEDNLSAPSARRTTILAEPGRAEVYAVAGSFNDLKYAYERSMIYRNYNTHIVESPGSSLTRFRVVIGPLEDKSLVDLISVPDVADLEPLWTTELCALDLSSPPCHDAGLLANTEHRAATGT